MVRLTRPTPYLLATSALLAWGLGPGDHASGMSARVREAFRNDLPNPTDYERLEHGYYEQLLSVARPPANLASLDPNHPDVTVDHGRLTIPVDDIREYILKPDVVFDPTKKNPWSTNSHGMRDREYPIAKPTNTLRVALVGDSIATGWRVNDDEGFEPLLEVALDTKSKATGGPAIEILNFAVPGHGPGQRWSHFSQVGWRFEPDLILFEATPADPGWDERRLRGLLERGIGRDAPVYREVLDHAHAPHQPGLEPEFYKGLLKPFRWELLEGVYRAAASDCLSQGVPVIWVLIPRVGKLADPADHKRLVEMAKASGFARVIDISDEFDGIDPHTLAVSSNDFHPNALGHSRLARRLEAALSDISALLPNPRPKPTPGPTPGEGVDPR